MNSNYNSVLSFLIVVLILYRYVNATKRTALQTEKPNTEPKIASYYPRVTFREASEQQRNTTSKRFIDKKSNNIDVTHPESAAGSPGMMLHHLIYELVQYKHIPRVSLLTCQQKDVNVMDIGNGSPTRHQQQLEQARTSINIDTLTILRSFFTGQNNRRRRRYKRPTTTTDGINISNSFSSSEWLDGVGHGRSADFLILKGILIKILRIDLLINSQASENFANKNNDKPDNNSKDATNASELLATFLRSEVLRQFVILDLSCGIASRKVLEMASNKGLFNSSYHWLLIEDYTFNRKEDDDEEESDVRFDAHQLLQDISSDDVGTLNAPDPVPIAFTTNSADAIGTSSGDDKINKDGRRNNLNDDDDDNDVNDNKVFNSSNMAKDENILLIEKFLEEINININTELILAKRINEGRPESNSKKDYYMLYDVWNPGFQYGGSLNITEIGNFSQDNGLQLQKWYRQSNTIIRRINMNNANIRCMIVITNKNHLDNLEDYLTRQYDTHLDSMNRFNFALLSYVRDLFNFSLVMSRTPSWGYLKNGKFDGMIGALVRRQADIGGSPIFFRIERAKVIDYTTRTWIARPCFIFRHPRTVRADQIVFLQPFANDVWVLVAICGMATIALMAVLTIVEQKMVEQAISLEHKLKTNAMDVGITKKQHNTPREKTTIEVDIEESHFTRKNTTPLARIGLLRDAAAWFVASREESGCEAVTNPTTTLKKNAITLPNGKFNIKVGIKQKKERVPVDYGEGSSVLLEQSEIDCIDNGVRASGPINVVRGVSLNNHGHCLKMGITLRKYLSRWMKNFRKTNGNGSNKKQWEIILESMLFYIGSICQQGLSLSTNLLSCRCVIITSLLFSFCIYQFYSASIVGTLLMEKPKTIKTLRDLVHSSLEIGIEDIVYNRDFFLHTKDPDAIQLYASVSLPPDTDSSADNDYQTSTKRNPFTPSTNYSAIATASNHRDRVQSKRSEASNWYDPEYGVAKIKQGGFAFHVDVATAYKIISDIFTEREICDLSEIQLFPPQKMVSIVQKGSPLKKIITYGLRRSTEAGLMDYQRKVWHSPKPRCVKQIQTDDLMVDMQTFTSAVFVLIFGFAASIVVLVLEMVHNNLWQQFAT